MAGDEPFATVGRPGDPCEKENLPGPVHFAKMKSSGLKEDGKASRAFDFKGSGLFPPTTPNSGDLKFNAGLTGATPSSRKGASRRRSATRQGSASRPSPPGVSSAAKAKAFAEAAAASAAAAASVNTATQLNFELRGDSTTGQGSEGLGTEKQTKVAKDFFGDSSGDGGFVEQAAEGLRQIQLRDRSGDKASATGLSDGGMSWATKAAFTFGNEDYSSRRRRFSTPQRDVHQGRKSKWQAGAGTDGKVSGESTQPSILRPIPTFVGTRNSAVAKNAKASSEPFRFGAAAPHPKKANDGDKSVPFVRAANLAAENVSSIKIGKVEEERLSHAEHSVPINFKFKPPGASTSAAYIHGSPAPSKGMSTSESEASFSDTSSGLDSWLSSRQATASAKQSQTEADQNQSKFTFTTPAKPAFNPGRGTSSNSFGAQDSAATPSSQANSPSFVFGGSPSPSPFRTEKENSLASGSFSQPFTPSQHPPSSSGLSATKGTPQTPFVAGSPMAVDFTWQDSGSNVPCTPSSSLTGTASSTPVFDRAGSGVAGKDTTQGAGVQSTSKSPDSKHSSSRPSVERPEFPGEAVFSLNLGSGATKKTTGHKGKEKRMGRPTSRLKGAKPMGQSVTKPTPPLFDETAAQNDGDRSEATAKPPIFEAKSSESGRGAPTSSIPGVFPAQAPTSTENIFTTFATEQGEGAMFHPQTFSSNLNFTLGSVKAGSKGHWARTRGKPAQLKKKGSKADRTVKSKSRGDPEDPSVFMKTSTQDHTRELESVWFDTQFQFQSATQTSSEGSGSVPKNTSCQGGADRKNAFTAPGTTPPPFRKEEEMDQNASGLHVDIDLEEGEVWSTSSFLPKENTSKQMPETFASFAQGFRGAGPSDDGGPAQSFESETSASSFKPFSFPSSHTSSSSSFASFFQTYNTTAASDTARSAAASSEQLQQEYSFCPRHQAAAFMQAAKLGSSAAFPVHHCNQCPAAFSCPLAEAHVCVKCAREGEMCMARGCFEDVPRPTVAAAAPAPASANSTFFTVSSSFSSASSSASASSASVSSASSSSAFHFDFGPTCFSEERSTTTSTSVQRPSPLDSPTTADLAASYSACPSPLKPRPYDNNKTNNNNDINNRDKSNNKNESMASRPDTLEEAKSEDTSQTTRERDDPDATQGEAAPAGAPPDISARRRVKVKSLRRSKPPAPAKEQTPEWLRLKKEGTALYSSGSYKKAVAKYSQAIAMYGGSDGLGLATLYWNRAACHMMRREFEKANDDCKAAIHADPTFVKSYLRAARGAINLGQFERAQKRLDELSRNCKDIRSHYQQEANDCRTKAQLLSNYYRDMVRLYSANRLSDAEQAADRALNIAPYGQIFYVYKSKCLAKSENWKTLYTQLERLGEMLKAPDDPPDAINAKTPYEKKKFEFTGDVKRMGGELGLLYGKAFAYDGQMEKGRWAIEALLQAKWCVEVCRSLLGKWDKVEKLKEEGNDYFKRGKFTLAEQIYSRALKVDPALKDIMSVLYCNRAAARMAQGRYADAVRDCDEALRRDPDYKKAKIRRARANVCLKKYDDALRDFMDYAENHCHGAEYSEVKQEMNDVIRQRDKEAEEKERQRRQKKVQQERKNRWKTKGPWRSTFGTDSQFDDENFEDYYNGYEWDDFDDGSYTAGGAGYGYGYGSGRRRGSKQGSSSSSYSSSSSSHHTRGGSNYGGSASGSSSGTSGGRSGYGGSGGWGSRSESRKSQSSEPQCHYKVLGVAQTATAEEIKKSYRKLALKYHPDKCSDSNSAELFKSISHSYSILSDPAEKRRYDRTKLYGFAF